MLIRSYAAHRRCRSRPRGAGGDPTPSSDDVATTLKIMRAADLVGLPIVDHVIVTRDERHFHAMHAHGTAAKLTS